MTDPSDIARIYRNVERIRSALGENPDVEREVKDYLASEGLNGLPPRPVPDSRAVALAALKKRVARTANPADWLAQNIPVAGPFMDELSGVAGGVGSYLGAKLKGEPATLKESVAEGIDDARARVGGMQRALGPLALPGQVLIGGAGFKAAAARGPELLKKLLGPSSGSYLARVGKQAAKGATIGGVMGAGAGEGDKRLSAATAGATMGGALSAGVEAVAPLVRTYIPMGIDKAKAFVANWRDRTDPSRMAYQMLGRQFAADKIDPLAAARAASDDAIMADLAGPFGQRTIRDAASQANPEATTLREVLEARDIQRQIPVGERVQSGAALSRSGGPLMAEAELAAAHKPGVNAAYKQAMDAGAVLPDEALAKLLASPNPIMRRGVQDAKRIFAMDDKRLPETVRQETVVDRGMTIPIIGSAKSRTPIYSLDFADQVKRSIDDQLKSATRPGGDLNVARMAKQVKTRLVEQLDALVPEYPAARALHNQWQAELDGLRLGQKAASGSIDPRDYTEVLARKIPGFSKLSPDGREAVERQFAQGIGYRLRLQIEKTAGEPNALVKLFARPHAEAMTRAAFTDPADFAAFQDAATQRLQQIAQTQQLYGNPAATQALIADPVHGLSPWSMAKALSGSPLLLASQGLKIGSEQLTKQAEQAAAGRIADIAAIPVKSPTGSISPRMARALQLMRNRPSAAPTAPWLQNANTKPQAAFQALLELLYRSPDQAQQR